MYIDIFLGFVVVVSIYMVWKRITGKIPALILIPDRDLSELLEENTAKFQLFFLHLFHFRSFYRERHYHEKIRRIISKFIYKFHINLLRFDNSVLRLLKRVRSEHEYNGISDHAGKQAEAMDSSQQKQTLEFNVQKTRQTQAPITSGLSRVQEVRLRRRTSATQSLPRKKKIENLAMHFPENGDAL